MLSPPSHLLVLGCREGPPIFLAPILARSPKVALQLSPFSTSATYRGRKRGRSDNNPDRGVSALRRTGLRKHVSISLTVRLEGLPKPVLDAKRRTKPEVDPDHGLYGFFNEKKQLLTDPKEENQHGRAWTPAELRHKSWEDIHSLWWMCCKERNRLATEKAERERLKIGREDKGEKQARWRDMEVRRTQKAIKYALTERYYAWDDAWKLAQNDPTINLEASDHGGPVYEPKNENGPSSNPPNFRNTSRSASGGP